MRSNASKETMEKHLCCKRKSRLEFYSRENTKVRAKWRRCSYMSKADRSHSSSWELREGLSRVLWRRNMMEKKLNPRQGFSAAAPPTFGARFAVWRPVLCRTSSIHGLYSLDPRSTYNPILTIKIASIVKIQITPSWETLYLMDVFSYFSSYDFQQ